jgi:protein involved in polysaccharide export with SLBB domain
MVFVIPPGTAQSQREEAEEAARQLSEEELKEILAREGISPDEAARLLSADEELGIVGVLEQPEVPIPAEQVEPEEPEVPEHPGLREDETVLPFGFNLFAAATSQFAPLADMAPGPDYVLGPGDQLIVTLWGSVEFSGDLEVNREGRIVLPEVGVIRVAGLTIADVEAKLTKEFGRVYKDFFLDVSLGEMRAITVFVVGDVRRPGAYRVSSMATAFHALYVAGGPAAHGSLRDVKVIRNNQVISKIDFYEYLLRGDKGHDVRLEAGDTIFIPPVGKTSIVVGEVRRPAQYELVGGESVTDLIELAGGLTAASYVKRLQLDRIVNNERRVVRDVDLSASMDDSLGRLLSDIPLMDGDLVRVFRVLDVRTNMVRLTGNVEREGVYELKPGMRIRDIILAAEGILLETYMQRAEIVRLKSHLTVEILAFDLGAALDGDPEHNLLLQNQDWIVVYAEAEVKPADRVAIFGNVRNEGTYELAPNMQVSDVIFRAGGLKESAHLLEGYVSRVMPPQAVDSDSISILISFNVQDVVTRDDSPENIRLRPHDKVIIRSIPGWQLQELVYVTGEVRFPGPYSLTRKGERFSDLIVRAGGTTAEAFLKGASFIRPEEGRVIVDMKKALKNPGEREDIMLVDRDSIHVPRVPSTVRVTGPVMREGSLAHVPGKTFRYYLERTGGLTEQGDSGNIRIVRVDGVVEKAEKRFWFDPRLEAGNTIVVGVREEREEIDWSETIRDATSILASVATTVYLVTRLK